MSYRKKFHPCIHIKTANLADGTYELVPVDVQVNLTEVVEDPNQCSEEPKTNRAQEGKPWCI